MTPTAATHLTDEITPWEETSSRSVREFLRTESGSAGLLLAATIIALIWANVSGSYEDLWHTKLTVSLGGATIDEDLRHWVNDGLMAFFFYLVGLEIRRELSLGELRDRAAAAVPAVAAIGGMVVPALLYLAVNAGGEGADGWGIVMATDIAFVLGAVALMGSRCPPGVRVFLLTLAIVDDIGAVTVIAVFYSDGIDLLALAGAVGVIALVVAGRRFVTWRGPAYVVAGVAAWLLAYASGVHPTIAAVALGMVTAVHPPDRDTIARAASIGRVFRRDLDPAGGRAVALEVSSAVSPNERFQEAIHPWTSYLVVPVFALANAGVALGGGVLGDALTSPITLGIVLGLVGGKILGVSLTSLAATGFGLGHLPQGMRSRHLAPSGAFAGIGFTVSLFVTDLAFDSEALREQAKVGVLIASVLAADIGFFLFRRMSASEEPADSPHTLEPPPDGRTDHVLGDPGAEHTLVVYGDYSCPHTRAAWPVLRELTESAQPIRLVFRHLPIEDAHPDAPLAAEAAEAAGVQGQFWGMHERLMAETDTLPAAELVQHAEALGLDVKRFGDDLRHRVHAPGVTADVDSARRSGAPGTPALYADGELSKPSALPSSVRERISSLP